MQSVLLIINRLVTDPLAASPSHRWLGEPSLIVVWGRVLEVEDAAFLGAMLDTYLDCHMCTHVQFANINIDIVNAIIVVFQ